MPELPEVEIIKRQLLPLKGKQIAQVEADDSDLFSDELTPKSIVENLTGENLIDFERYGKYLLIGVQAGWLIFHPRMSGKVWFRDEKPPGPDKVKLKLSFAGAENKKLYFTTVRRFSRFYWQAGADILKHPKIKKMGPDPLHDNYTFENFAAGLQGRSGAVKNLLMNQEFLAGLGNIYVCEICFLAAIDPARPANELSEREINLLFEIIPEVLEEALEAGGSSLNRESSATAYRGTDGSQGSYEDSHRVYGREKEECVGCGAQIKRIKLGGRSTFYCPSCQK